MARLNIKLRAMTPKKKSGGMGLFIAVIVGLGLVWVYWQIHLHQVGTKAPGHDMPPGAIQAPAPLTGPSMVVSRTAVPVGSSNSPIRTVPPVARPTVSVQAPVLPPSSLVVSTSTPAPVIVIRTNLVPAVNQATNTIPVPSPEGFPRPVQNLFEAQLALARQGISSGSLDGVIGSQTHAALRAYQRDAGMAVTGDLDTATRARLELDDPPFTTYTVTDADLARLHPVPTTWLEKSKVASLDYESILELVAEKSWSHPNFIKRINPSINWTNVAAGVQIKVPKVERPSARARATVIRIYLASKILEAFDGEGRLLAHFPCSIAARVEKRPVGELHVSVFALDPDYTFDPEVFPESPEARTITKKLRIPPGPNNPVGVAWISLDKPGYGIHGTPRPEDVGRTESHGCFRLANWNADFVVRLVAPGTPVLVEP